MSYTNWPNQAPPYVADTHVAPYMPLDSKSIRNGIARDIANIQHNINTTHLFASGWLTPVASGWFENIDVSNLFINTLYADNLTLHDINNPYELNIDFKIGDKSFYFEHSAIRNCKLQSDELTAGSDFILNSNSFTYNGPSISGGMYNYNIYDNEPWVVEGIMSNVLTTFSNSPILNINDGSLYIVEKPNRTKVPVAIDNSSVLFNSIGGHNHINNKIYGGSINETNIIFDDLIVDSDVGDIQLYSGIIDASNYIVSANHDKNKFVEMKGVDEGIYIIEDISYSGSISELDIYTDHIVPFSGKLYANSRVIPTSGNIGDTYIYETDDFQTWRAIKFEGLSISGCIGSVQGMIEYKNDLWVMTSHSVSGGNQLTVQNMTDSEYAPDHGSVLGDASRRYYKIHANSIDDDASAYPFGMDVIDGNLFIYGYTGTHTVKQPLRWDEHTYYDYIETQSTVMGTGDMAPCISGVVHEYTKPMLIVNYVDYFYDGGPPIKYHNELAYTFNDHLSGSGQMNDAEKNRYYNSVIRNDSDNVSNYSGCYYGLFGNGFNEVTALIHTRDRYDGNKRSYFSRYPVVNPTYSAERTKWFPGYVENIDNTKPLLIFGNSNISTTTSGDVGTIFGGNVPIVINSSPTMPNASNSEWYPDIPYLYGAKSIYDDSVVTNVDMRCYRAIVTMSDLYSTYDDKRGILWGPDYLIAETFLFGKNVEVPSYLTTPFCNESYVYYKHDGYDKFKLSYNEYSASGLLIPSGTYADTRNMPTFYDRVITDGFWSTKTLDWFIEGDACSGIYDPPSGSYPKTNYYSQVHKPINYHGAIYTILKYDTGFLYIGPDGTEVIDDGIIYDDIIEFGNQIYAIGYQVIPLVDSYRYILTMNNIDIENRFKVELNINAQLDIEKGNVRLFIYNNILYASIGDSKIIVKRPSHIDCIN